MKDEQASEEKLMGELELMYQHVAGLESGPSPDDDHHDPKIIPFPGKGIDSPSWETSKASEASDPSEALGPSEKSKASKVSKTSKTQEASEEEPLPEKAPFSRTYVIVVSVSVIFVASVFLMVILDLVAGPRGSKKREPLEVTAPIQLKSSPPVQKQEKVLQPAEQRQPQTETIPQETVASKSPMHQTDAPNSPTHQTAESGSPTHQTAESKSPTHQTDAPNSPTHQTAEPKSPTHQTALPEPVFTESMHYAVQMGAFSNWRNAFRRIDSLRKKNLDPYWIARQSRSRGTVYVIFSGSFTNRQEAVQFMEGKDIRKNYPGSFIRGISFS